MHPRAQECGARRQAGSPDSLDSKLMSTCGKLTTYY